MKETKITFDTDTEEGIKGTIRHLLEKMRTEKHIGTYSVAVKKLESYERCIKCSHLCTMMCYQVFDGAYVLLEYTSCDCGFTYIGNVGGTRFSHYPGEPSFVRSIDNGKIMSKPVTKAIAAKIIESKLIEFD